MSLHRVLVMAGLVLSAFTLACSDDTSGPGNGTAVDVEDDVFDPVNLQVTAGQTVTWTWRGSNPHTVTFDAGAPNSAQMTTGTFQRQFPTAGVFPYHCQVHASMTGTITVQ